MNQPQPDPHTVIAAALDDWWITTDPAEPFHAPAVAHHVDTYLTSFAYRITPTRNPMPTRRTIATVILLALTCTLSTVLAALRGEWGWAAAGALATGALTREGLRDLRDRRSAR